MNSDVKIQVKNVSKVFKMYNTAMDKMKEALSLSGKVMHTDFYALTDLSFDVKCGEILGIMGRNGSGKSTLLKMITGIYEPSGGEIVVTGKISSLLELGTGFNMEYTGIENIYFYGTLMGFPRKQMDNKVPDIIDFAEIGDYIYQPVKTYSSGMFARLAFSCAINVEPDILIVDEILSVGDMRFQAKCFNKFKEFKEKGVTIIYVGHDVGMMRTFCDTAMWIDRGRLIDIGDPTFISAKYTEFMYLDDISSFTDYKKLNDESVSSISGNESEEVPQQTEEVCEEPYEKPIQEKYKADESIFPDCIAHWGTSVGLVKAVNLLNANHECINYFNTDDAIEIEVIFRLPQNINLDIFSVAISIKNVEGTDLIVKTTYDENIHFQKSEDLLKVRFRLISFLAKGEYYLVVALENRESQATVYYEYIEGVKYFKVYSDKRIFGVFDPESQIFVDAVGEEKNGK